MKQTNLHNQATSSTFTGHRFIPYDKVPSLRKALEASVSEHYNRGIRIFYCGNGLRPSCRRNSLIHERNVFRHYIGCRRALSWAMREVHALQQATLSQHSFQSGQSCNTERKLC